MFDEVFNHFKFCTGYTNPKLIWRYGNDLLKFSSDNYSLLRLPQKDEFPPISKDINSKDIDYILNWDSKEEYVWIPIKMIHDALNDTPFSNMLFISEAEMIVVRLMIKSLLKCIVRINENSFSEDLRNLIEEVSSISFTEQRQSLFFSETGLRISLTALLNLVRKNRETEYQNEFLLEKWIYQDKWINLYIKPGTDSEILVNIFLKYRDSEQKKYSPSNNYENLIPNVNLELEKKDFEEMVKKEISLSQFQIFLSQFGNYTIELIDYYTYYYDLYSYNKSKSYSKFFELKITKKKKISSIFLFELWEHRSTSHFYEISENTIKILYNTKDTTNLRIFLIAPNYNQILEVKKGYLIENQEFLEEIHEIIKIHQKLQSNTKIYYYPRYYLRMWAYFSLFLYFRDLKFRGSDEYLNNIIQLWEYLDDSEGYIVKFPPIYFLDSKERIILEEIHDALGQAYNHYNWTIQNNKIVNISFNYKSLTFLPLSISKLENLEVLEVYNSSISYLPEDILSLQNLKEIHIYNSKFLKPPWFGYKMKNLEKIFLGENPYSPEFQILDKQDLTTSQKKAICFMATEKIDQEGLEYLLNATKERCNYFEYWKLLCLFFISIEKYEIGSDLLIKVMEMDERDPEIDILIPKLAEENPNIANLKIALNRLGEREILDQVNKGLTKDSIFYIKPIYNKEGFIKKINHIYWIDDKIHPKVFELSHLSELSILHTKMNKLDINILKLPNLKKLIFENNKLTEPPYFIDELKNLKYISLSGNPWETKWKIIEHLDKNDILVFGKVCRLAHPDNNFTPIELLEKVVEIADKNAYVWLELGYLYKQQDQLQDALRCFQKAYEQNPTDHSIIFELGIINLELKNFDETISTFINGLSFHSKSVLFYIYLSNAYMEQMRLIDRSNEEGEKKWQTKNLLADSAIREAEINLDLETTSENGTTKQSNTVNLSHLSVAYFNRRNFVKCVELCRNGISFNKNNVYSYINLGAALCEQEKYEEAIDILERGKEIQKMVSLYVNLAYSYLNLKDFDQAFKMINSGFAINLAYVKLWVLLGRIFTNQGKYRRAWYCFRSLIGKGDDVYEGLAEYCRFQEEYIEAKKWIKKAIKEDTGYRGHWRNFLELAIIYVKLNNKTKAKKYFNIVLELHPESKDAHKWLEQLNQEEVD